MPENYIYEAFIKVIPDTTGFRKELTAELERSIGAIRAFPIEVVPKLAPGFRTDLVTQVERSIASVRKFPILVVPDAAGFRGALAVQLKEQLAGLTVPVPVVPVVEGAARPAEAAGAAIVPPVVPVIPPPPPPGTGGTGGRAPAATAEAKALAKAESDAAAATARLEGILNAALTPEERLAQLEALLVQVGKRRVDTLIAEQAAQKGLTDTQQLAFGVASRQIAAVERLTAAEQQRIIAARTAAPARAAAAAGIPAIGAGAFPGAAPVHFIPTPIAEAAGGTVQKLTADERALLKLQASLATSQEFLNRATAAGVAPADALANAKKAEAQSASLDRRAIGLEAQARLSNRTQLADEIAAIRVSIIAHQEEIATTKIAAESKIKEAASSQLEAAAKERLASVEDRLAIFKSQSVAETVKQLGTDQASLSMTNLLADAKKTETKALIDQVAILRQMIGVQVKIVEAENANIDSTSTLAGEKKVLTAIIRGQTAAHKLLLDAEATENETLVGLAAELERVIALRRTDQVETVKETIAAGQQAKVNEAALRGAGARVGTAFGLRGATLAASAPFLIGTAAATALFETVKVSGEFQKSLLQIQQATRATAPQMAVMSEASKTLASSLHLSQISANQTAEAIDILTHSGLGLVDAAAAARGALLLVAGGQIGLQDATRATVEVLRAFSLSADQSVQVADALTNAAQATHSSMAEVVQAFDAVGPVAARSGLSMQDTITLLVQIIESGTDASRAASQLRQSLLRLEAPSKSAAKALAELHLSAKSFIDDQGHVRPDSFVILGNALKELDTRLGLTAQQAAVLNHHLFAQIFSARAVAGALVLAGQGAQGLAKTQEELTRTGTAALRAQVEAKTLSGQIQILKAQLSNLGVATGTVAVPAVSALLSGFTRLVSDIGKSVDALTRLGSALTAQSAPLLGLGGAAHKSHGFFAPLLNDLKQVAVRAEVYTAEGPVIGGLSLLDKALASAPTMQTNAQIIADSIGKIGDEANKAGTLGIPSLIALLQSLAIQLQTAGPRGRAFAKVLSDVADQITKTGRVPADLGLKIKLLLDKADLTLQANELAPVIHKSLGDTFAAFFYQNPFNIDVNVNIKPHVTPPDKSVLQLTASQYESFLQKQARERFVGLQARFRNQLGRLEEEFTNLQIAGAPDPLLLANLRAQEAVLRRAAAAAGHHTVLRRKLEDAIAQIVSQEQGILANEASTAKSAADKAKQARDARDQAVIATFDPRIADINNRLTLAAARGQIALELSLNQQLLHIYESEERRAFLNRIKDLKTRRDFLRQTEQNVAQTTAQIIQLQQQIAQNLIAAAEGPLQRRIDLLDLRAQIADAEGKTGAEIKIERAEIRLYQAQLRKLHRLKQTYDVQKEELNVRLKIANLQKQIKDQEKKNQDTAKGIREQEFNFLTSLQGFTFNVLGNLLGASFGGLVGPDSGQTSPGPGAGPSVAGVPLPPRQRGVPPTFRGIADFRLGQQRRREDQRNVSHLQGDTLIDVNRKILHVLELIAKGLGHPEAEKHRKKATTPLIPHGA